MMYLMVWSSVIVVRFGINGFGLVSIFLFCFVLLNGSIPCCCCCFVVVFNLKKLFFFIFSTFFFMFVYLFCCFSLLFL